MEKEEATKKIEALTRGNTDLIDALMSMVNQFFYTPPDGQGVVKHSFMSAEEEAISVLIEAGFAEGDERKGFVLLWDKMEERRMRDLTTQETE